MAAATWRGGGGAGGTGGWPAATWARSGPGPWPLDDLRSTARRRASAAASSTPTPTTAQNIWAANGETLYVLRPGSTTFQAFTAADGLHIGPFTDPDGNAER